MGTGVSGCATCDGFFYRGQEVAVVGGGNTAVEEALYLSNIASKVHVVHRRDKFRAEAILVDKLMAKVEAGKDRAAPVLDLDEVLGDASGVTASGSAAPRTTPPPRSSSRLLHRHRPPAEHRHLQGPAGDEGRLHPDQDRSEGFATATSVPGVFAAGDVQDHVYRQAITSAGTGCMAALDAQRFLEQA
jgi:thioredoxin reductase (NADPH)